MKTTAGQALRFAACARAPNSHSRAATVGDVRGVSSGKARELIHSNYSLDQSGWRDSNPRPPAPKAGALTKLRHIPLDAEAYRLMRCGCDNCLLAARASG